MIMLQVDTGAHDTRHPIILLPTARVRPTEGLPTTSADDPHEAAAHTVGVTSPRGPSQVC